MGRVSTTQRRARHCRAETSYSSLLHSRAASRIGHSAVLYVILSPRCGNLSLTVAPQASISEHGGNPVLAVDGHVDLFSLCPESNKTDSQIILRFNATAENSVSQEFDNEGCEPVTVYMLY